MKTGTKSVLFGAHCFFIHPLFVALAWWKLFGFPWDPRLWVAFFVHDLGYWGCEKNGRRKRRMARSTRRKDYGLPVRLAFRRFSR